MTTNQLVEFLFVGFIKLLVGLLGLFVFIMIAAVTAFAVDFAWLWNVHGPGFDDELLDDLLPRTFLGSILVWTFLVVLCTRRWRK